MTARIFIALFLMLAAAIPTHAQGNGNGNSGNSSNAGGNGNAGNGNMENGDAGHRSGNAGNGGGQGPNDPGSGRPPIFTEPTVVPEEDILAMVKSGQAVSLSSLLPVVQERSGGQIIDAQLVRTPRTLIYAVKVLTPDGRVGTEYYNARSGAYIEVQ